jgi:DNA-directed RNA polymerase specialized sigma24 family protein
VRREIATNFHRHSSDGDGGTYVADTDPAASRRPFSPIEALMSAAPGEAVETSQMEMLALRDLLSDAIDALPPRHRWVLEQNLIARIPVRTLGDWMGLGKSYVWMLKEEALAMLRESLQDHPTIQAYLHRHEETDE